MDNDDLFDREYDPYDLIEEHDEALKNLIIAHNEVATFAQTIAEQLIHMNARIDKLERFIIANISNEVK